MEENNLLFQNIEIKDLLKPIKILKCNRCDILIDKLIGSTKICKKCFNLRAKEYNQKKKSLLEKEPRKNMLKEYDYINTSGEIVKVRMSNVNKQCITCNEIKYYTEFYIIRDSKTNYIYLNPKCIICLNKYYNNIKREIRQNNKK